MRMPRDRALGALNRKEPPECLGGSGALPWPFGLGQLPVAGFFFLGHRFSSSSLIGTRGTSSLSIRSMLRSHRQAYEGSIPVARLWLALNKEEGAK
jgi:hypothetical protein